MVNDGKWWTGGTERERAANAARMREQRAAGRDVSIPKCADPLRRGRCKRNPLLFMRTYFGGPPNAELYPNRRGMFGLEPSAMHLEGIDGLKRAILYGGMEAWVWPRGGGKDTIAELMTIWAVCYGHARFAVFATYEARQSQERIEEIKLQFEINELLMADFPEICAPIRALERAAQRARTQTVNGQHTRLVWQSDFIKLPVVMGSMASGAIIASGSINASIRGMRIDGQRPDFVIISDPQTRESAKSLKQTADILEAINQDFGGLSSHEEHLSVVGLMTVIRGGDVADQLTNRDLNPQWHGKRYKAFEKWPERMDLWHQYLDLKRAGDRSGDTTGREATRFYEAHRAEMDAGAEAYWPEAYVRKAAEDGSPLELSAVQHLMNLYYTWGEDAFMTEFQNEPPEDDLADLGITEELVRSRVNGYPLRVIPEVCERWAVGVDVRGVEIHYVALASTMDAAAAVTDYGIINRDRAEPESREGAGREQALRRWILQALQELEDSFVAMPLRKPDETAEEVQLWGVDLQYGTDAVYGFCGSRLRWLPVRGLGSMKGQARFTLPAPKKGQTRKTRPNWYASKQPNGQVIYNSNVDYWKLRVHEGFGQAPMTPGSISLWGSSPEPHRRFAKHICAERFSFSENKWEQVSKWNHWLDCTAIAMMLLDRLGVRLLAEEEVRARKGRRRRTFGPVVAMG